MTRPKSRWRRRLSRAVYEKTGLGPTNLDVVEIHDAAAPAEFILSEQLGFCAPGEAVSLLHSGRTALGGADAH